MLSTEKEISVIERVYATTRTILMTSSNTLRAITNRLNSIPVQELPQKVGYLATSLYSCEHVLRQSSTGNNEISVLLHKLKTRVSTLLQDRSPEGRLSGLVMVKALVEVGGLSFLSESGSWVRNLITCLNKSDPWEVKRLCLSTLTRIYILTVSHQALIREIATPTLPAFITASLAAIKPTISTVNGKTVRALSPLLETVLTIWHTLIQHFASTFRPHVNSLRAISLSLLSDDHCPLSVYVTANRLFARLHFCAPRNTVNLEWSQTCSHIIEAAHDTADLIFRAVVEDWKPTVPRISKITQKQRSADVPASKSADVLGLDRWSGISEGASRLVAHVNLLRHFLTSEHSQAARIPLGHIFDLTSRLSAVTLPTQKFSLRVNNEITRDEREEFWLNIPRIHAAMLKLLEALVRTYGQVLLPVAETFSIQLWDIFEAEYSSDIIRTATYNLVSALLSHGVLSISKSDAANISLLVNQSCNDLKQQSGLEISSNFTNGDKPGIITLALSTPTTQGNHSLISQTKPELYKAAHDLFPILLTYLPFHLVPGSSSLRANLDSTAILIQHREAILASTLNPPQSRFKSRGKTSAPSLLPFLARSETDSHLETLAKEALLRPRMPVIQAKNWEEADDIESNESEIDEQVYDNGIEMEVERVANDARKMSLPRELHGPNNSIEGVDEPNDTLPDMQRYSTAQKRDFTALLEQSANAQLAADGVSPSRYEETNLAEPEEFVPKRSRLDVNEAIVADTELEAASGPSTGDDNNMDVVQPADEIPVVAIDETTSYNVASKDADAVNANTFVEKGKETLAGNLAGDGDSDSSDSEIPPIDATLLAFDDSEDEDEDDDDQIDV